MRKDKIAVLMSGGVDSTLAAILLKEEGHEVLGITGIMQNTLREHNEFACTAKKVAKEIGIEHLVVDATDDFEKFVIEPFCDEYYHGRTPNPCIVCNKHIKFSFLFNVAKKYNCNFIATGHYASLEHDMKQNRYYFRTNFSHSKDQAYFLFSINQKVLSKLILPLKNFNKEKSREMISKYNLDFKKSEESQEICFVPDNNYAKFLFNRKGIQKNKGPILSTKGKLLGEHNGIWCYTVGQRKGLGISYPKPLYIIDIQADKNIIVVGEDKDLYKSSLNVIAPEFMKLSEDEAICNSHRCLVKIRSTMQPEKAVVNFQDKKRFNIKFDKPVRAVTKGQAAVCYDMDGATLFGGWIN